jgi:hypothetical protein
MEGQVMSQTNAKKRGRPVTDADCSRIAEAIEHLKCARDLLGKARANNTAAKVRSALKSAEGAANNAHAHFYRENHRPPMLAAHRFQEN